MLTKYLLRIRWVALEVVLLFALTAPVGAAMDVANVVPNPSFEAPATAAAPLPGWQVVGQITAKDIPDPAGGAVQVLTSAASAHSGQHAVQIINRNGTNGRGLQSKSFPLPNHPQVEASVWARGKPGSIFGFEIIGDVRGGNTGGSFKVTDEWHRYSLLVIPDAKSKHSVQVRIHGFMAGAHGNLADPLIVVDDVSVAPITTGLDPMYGVHMVLQRDQPIPLRGWAETPGQAVTIEFHGQTKTTTADAHGRWQVVLDPLPAGGPFTLRLSGTPVEYDDVLIGDVWLCAGQSNMEFGMMKILGIYNWQTIPPVVEHADYPTIRLWAAENGAVPAPAPQYPPETRSWVRCDKDGLLHTGPWGGFSAVGFFFGREINHDISVPIGLIQLAHGGTAVEAWWSPAAAAQAEKQGLRSIIPTYAAAQAKEPPLKPTRLMNTISTCYNAEVAPLLPYACKGVLWYQGENNGPDHDYAPKLRLLIDDWRTQFGQPALPVLIVQLPNWTSMSPQQQAKERWQLIREAQQQVAATTTNCALAVTMDLADTNKDEHDGIFQIHPRNKADVGHRLALAAERLVYGRELVARGPVFQTLKQEGNKLRLAFTPDGGGLMAQGGQLAGFFVAGADHNFAPAAAVIDGDTVIVSSPKVPNPVAARYEFSSYVNPLGTLYNKAGLPAGPFRTDDWPVAQ